ncbi:MAG: hypothetical protein ACI3ZL_01655 [Candidatus Cryptobacteroides sp.]
MAVVSGRKIKSVTLGLAHTYHYSYDQYGRLSAMDVPNYHEYTFDYSDEEYVTANNRFFPVRIFPDSNGRVDYYEVLYVDGSKRFVKFDYTADGLARQVDCFKSDSIDGEREIYFSQSFEHSGDMIICTLNGDENVNNFPAYLHESKTLNNFNIPIVTFAVPFRIEDVITPVAIFSHYLPDVIEMTDSYNNEVESHQVMYGRDDKGDICSISVIGTNMQFNIEYYD